jgi:CubicO group peptidase (beta-lactamase class C family)
MLTTLRYVPSPLRNVVMATAEVPRSLASVTTVDAGAEIDPEAVGMTKKGVRAIWRSVEKVYSTGMQPGISFVLRRHGQVVLRRAIGHARGNGPGDAGENAVLMTPDTPVCLYSASKAIAAMLVHLLSERKEVSLLDPVSHYIPAFGQNGKRNITIYQLLCHKAGIPTVDSGEVSLVDLLLDQKEILRRLYAAAPEKPGQHHAYHALTAGFVIADLVETVSGQSFRRFFRDQVTGPLGLDSMEFGARPATLRKLARNYETGLRISAPVDLYLRRAIGTSLGNAVRISNDPRFYKALIPAGNGVSTADDTSRFFQCLLDGGILDGVRIFSPLTVRRATAEVGRPEVDRSLLVPLRYSAGMMLGDAPFGLYGPDTRRAFGHLGFTNNFVWADPERDISVALLTTGKLVAGLHLPYLLGLLRNISRHCGKLSDQELGERELASGLY